MRKATGAMKNPTKSVGTIIAYDLVDQNRNLVCYATLDVNYGNGHIAFEVKQEELTDRVAEVNVFFPIHSSPDYEAAFVGIWNGLVDLTMSNPNVRIVGKVNLSGP